ncbi:MAG TPA: VOC family protein [Candidimonas sp.]|nr:VOC family protein [Candidimonas sp.]
MSVFPGRTKTTIIPCLRYRNASAAIAWLCSVFGFKQQAVYPNADGTIAHAQLVFGNGMIMLGSASASQWGKLIKQPDEIEGAETQSAYIIVADADVLYDRAKAAGAEILLDIKDEDYGGRGFTCRDLEGHIWNFGTYDPWQEASPQPEDQAYP